ncbi:hypothetical protein [Nocardia wallacei]|uniref:hypothetical protein n=1 Tax=Nocardia wallacei TaxID=480035 RepID=UPI002454B20C|nr:hypothetical protein [Nocardia wallacei]
MAATAAVLMSPATTGVALAFVVSGSAGDHASATQPRPAADDRYADTTMADLLPHGVEGPQQHLDPNPDQWKNARAIVGVVRERGLPAYAAVLSLATALQESTLRNVDVAVDHDSLGLFQQRPSMGWGTPQQLTDPAYATRAFLDAVSEHAPNYQSVPLWQAAQATQRSAYPTLYAKWQEQAAQMVLQILHEG